MKQKFNKDTTLEEVIKFEDILHKHGVPCITCPYAKMEMDKLTLGEICKMYGLDLKSLLEELN